MLLKQETEGWVARATALTIPDEGMSLNAFGLALRCDPVRAKRAAQYLHRRKVIFQSSQGGHVRIYRQSGNLIGRPPKPVAPEMLLIDPRLARLLREAHPILLGVKLLRREMPGGDWRNEPERRAEITDAIKTEGERLITLCRRFLTANDDLTFDQVREALWLDQSDILPAITTTQWMLQPGGPEALPVDGAPVAKRRVSSKVGDHERVQNYVVQAGRAGITVSDVVYKFGGRADRTRIDQIVRELETVSMVISVECRTSSRGRAGTRLFDPKYGQPNLTPGGKLLIPMTMDEAIPS